MKIIAHKKHPGGPNFFEMPPNDRHVKEFIVPDEQNSIVTIDRAVTMYIRPWAEHEIVRCDIWWNGQEHQPKPQEVCYLDISGSIWWTPPVTTIGHHVDVIKQAVRFFEMEARADFLGDDPSHTRIKRAREAIRKAEERLHDFILIDTIREVERRAWQWSKDQKESTK